MARRFTLAIDATTREPIHIEDAPEGFANAVCADCEGQLEASNLNRSTRQVAQYFRHKKNTGNNCSGMSALHLYAQRILQNKCEVALPSFTHPPTPSHGITPDIEVSSYIAKLEEAKLEEPYPTDNQLIADVAATEVGGSRIYFEIWVHHKVSPTKKAALIDANLDVVEIDLGSLINRPDASKADIEEAVLFSAPREWIAYERFNDDISRLTHHDTEPSTVSEAERTLLENYSQVTNRRAALTKLEAWLQQEGAPGNKTFGRLMRQFGEIPLEVNVPVEHELAFKVHRTHWQTQILLWLQEHYDTYQKQNRRRGNATLRALIPEQLRDDRVDPTQLYKQLLDSGIQLTSVSSAFEHLAQQPLPEKFEDRPKPLKSLEKEDYQLIPKPLTAIENYLKAFGQNGILSYCAGNYWITQRRPEFNDLAFGPTKISRKGLLQYTPQTDKSLADRTNPGQ